MRIPVVELSDCILCGVCAAVCPSVFHLSDLGYVAVADLARYPEDAVNEAIKNCPAQCIAWEGEER
ncbi:MAG: ferredoxin [Desulfococcus multivorans]|jgi:ferredoxin|nr:ferredoxin [Desulfococcus multivorans]